MLDPRIRTHTLASRRDEQAVHCDTDGLFVGPVPLLVREAGNGLRKSWAARPLAEINRDLERCYGLPIDVGSKMSGIETIAQALDERDLARACIVAVHLRIPPILEASPQALWKCAAALSDSGMLDVGGAARLAKFNPHHDERGRFATADGARGADAERLRPSHAVRVAQANAGSLSDLPIVGPAYEAGRRTRRAWEDWRASSGQDSTPAPKQANSQKDDAAETQKQPAASVGAPPPNQEEPEDARGQGDAKSQRPRKPSYKIGASDGGPGKWAQANENMKPNATAYQQKATGAPQGRVYNVANSEAKSGVTSFDGYDPATDTLIDAKYWNKWPIDKKFSADSVLKQARSQIKAAKGARIVWKMPSPERAAKVRSLLEKKGFLGITVEDF